MRTHQTCWIAAALLAFVCSANADTINIQIGAAALDIGPNLTNFDTLTSASHSISLNLTPGVGETGVAFYDLLFTPSCSAAVCEGFFVRGLNFGFVSADDVTNPGSGSGIYIQPVRDTIGAANTTSSSHVLSLSTGGGVLINLSNHDVLTITVPPQTFLGVPTGTTAQFDSVGASFLLTEPAATVPEPSISALFAGVFAIMLLAACKQQLRQQGARRAR